MWYGTEADFCVAGVALLLENPTGQMDTYM